MSATIIDFPQGTTIKLGPDDFAIVLRKESEDEGMSELYMPADVQTRDGKASIELMLITLFQLALKDDDVLHELLDILGEKIDSLPPEVMQ